MITDIFAQTRICACTLPYEQCCGAKSPSPFAFPVPEPPTYHPGQTKPYNEQEEINELKERIVRLEKAISELVSDK